MSCAKFENPNQPAIRAAALLRPSSVLNDSAKASGVHSIAPDRTFAQADTGSPSHYRYHIIVTGLAWYVCLYILYVTHTVDSRYLELTYLE